MNNQSVALLNDYHFDKLWAGLISIYRVFSEVCDRHGLRYSVAFGTLLGAVRHQGFIPWDDDFDVFMPRSDYEKFLKIARRELPLPYRLYDKSTDNEYPNSFAKIYNIRKNEVTAIECSCGRPLNQGLFIDIFPLDGFPKNPMAKLVWMLCYYAIRAEEGYLEKEGSSSWRKRIEKIVGFILRPLFMSAKNKGEMKKYIDRLSMSYDFECSLKVGYVFDHAVISPKVFNRDVFDELVNIPFQNVQVKAIARYDEFLRERYGQYMEFPPVDKRKPSHVEQKIANWIKWI